MNLKKTVDNPALSPADRLLLQTIEPDADRMADQQTRDPLLGPPLRSVLPHRFPEQAAKAYYRTRAFLAGIPVGGLAARILEDRRVQTMADVEEATITHCKEYALHRDGDKLTALWRAAKAVQDSEYRIDFAGNDSEAWTQLAMHTDLSGEALADLIIENQKRAKEEYRRLANEDFPA